MDGMAGFRQGTMNLFVFPAASLIDVDFIRFRGDPMRIYLGPILQQLISAVVLCLALGTFGWVVWTAFETWSNDPTLDQIEQMRKSL